MPTLMGRAASERLSAAAQDKVLAETAFMANEEAFRMAVTRNGNGANEPKLTQVCLPTCRGCASGNGDTYSLIYQALNVFCDMQVKLEGMMTAHV